MAKLNTVSTDKLRCLQCGPGLGRGAERVASVFPRTAVRPACPHFLTLPWAATIPHLTHSSFVSQELHELSGLQVPVKCPDSGTMGRCSSQQPLQRASKTPEPWRQQPSDSCRRQSLHRQGTS